MGRALIGGLLRAGTRPEQLSVGEPSRAAREELAREFAVSASPDNAAAIAGAAIVVLAVKPQEAAGVLQPLAAPLATTRPLLLSGRRRPYRVASPVVPGRAGGARDAQPAGAARRGRHRPVRPAEVDARPARAPRRCCARWAGGVAASESELDMVTALSGSGPAYFFLLAELMARAGTSSASRRRPRSAWRWRRSTARAPGARGHGGSCAAARQRHLPGGTTEAALACSSGGFAALVARALQAATSRSRELAAQA